MNLTKAGVFPGGVIGGITGGILCKSFGTLATVGGVIGGLCIGGFVGWLYAGFVIFLRSIFSGVWNAICEHPNPEAAETEYKIFNDLSRMLITFTLIASTMISFKEVWYHGLILAGIMAGGIAFVSFAGSKYYCSKNNILKWKLFDLEKIEDTTKLIRYRHVMLVIVQLCIFTSIALVSGLAIGLAFGIQRVETIMLIVFIVIAALTMLPAIFFFVLIGEIENILTKRNVFFDHPIEERIQGWALKMMFWAVLAVLLPMLIRKLTGWQP